MSIPSEKQITDYLGESNTPVSTSDLYRVFNVRKDERQEFRRLLGALADQKAIEKRDEGYLIPTGLHQVEVLRVTGQNVDGAIMAEPENWKGQGQTPQVEVKTSGQAILKPGDRILARLSRDDDNQYSAEIIRRMDAPAKRVVGTIVQGKHGLEVHPSNRKNHNIYSLARRDIAGAQVGDLVVCDMLPVRGGPAPQGVKVAKILGNPRDPSLITSISLHEYGLRQEFSQAAVNETKGMAVPALQGRVDLRNIPLVTIDGPDSRDFDDAVFAERKPDGGHHLIVAIADVAYYVQPGSALDEEAYARGNSTYFPDAVVPMLPEKLSNDLCSLRPHEDRACLAVHMHIGPDGQIQSYEFVRGLMRSAARLTYEQVQAARDGKPDGLTAPLMDNVIEPLYDAYRVLAKAREERGVLDLDMPERKVLINDQHQVTGIAQRARMDSHRLIEEFMILANVAAATALEDQQNPCVYRIHDKPDAKKIDALRGFVGAFGLRLPGGTIDEAGQLRELLQKADDLPHSQLVKTMMLRTQSQAQYSPENIGHFGLALERYAHFTSPIRRYADLLVHRSLIEAFNLGTGGLTEEQASNLNEMSQHISSAERLSADAERSAVDRYTASWLSNRIGETFTAHIRGITKAGVFAQLDETGADTFIPSRLLPKDHYFYDEKQHALIGRRGHVFRMGAALEVRLKEADPLSGNMICEPASDESADLSGVDFGPSTPPGRPGGGHGGRHNRNRHRGGPNRGPR